MSVFIDIFLFQVGLYTLLQVVNCLKHSASHIVDHEEREQCKLNLLALLRSVTLPIELLPGVIDTLTLMEHTEAEDAKDAVKNIAVWGGELLEVNFNAHIAICASR